MKTIEVVGYLKGLEFKLICSTQEEIWLAINDLHKMGCETICYPFDDGDSLPKNYEERDCLKSDCDVVEDISEINLDLQDLKFIKKLLMNDYINFIDKPIMKEHNSKVYCLMSKIDVLSRRLRD